MNTRALRVDSAPTGARSGGHYDAVHTTGRAPHVRLDVDITRRTRTLLLSLVPCAVIGVHNTGYQTHLALTDRGLAQATGWRGELLRVVGLAPDPASLPACVLHGLSYLLPLLFVVAVTATLSERLFARLRRRDIVPGVSVTVLLFSFLLPASVPLWQAALAIAFGVIVGQEIFGGAGRNVFHPAIVGVAFLYFAFPPSLQSDSAWSTVEGFRALEGVHAAASGGMTALRTAGATWWSSFAGYEPGGLGDTSALGCVLGAAILVRRRIASWRVMLGMVLGLLGGVLMLSGVDTLSFRDVPWYWHVPLGSFAFGAVFLATDPVSGACTNAGRWIHGALVGVLVAVIRMASPVHADGTVLAILLGGVFAPLIDHAVVWVHVTRRRRRA